MTIMFYNSAEGVQSNVGETWFEAASQTGTLHDGQHFIWVNAEYGGLLTNRTVHIRVLVDGVERGYDHHTPIDSGEYKSFNTFGMLNVTVEGDHTVSLEIRGGHSSQTVGVRRIRLAIMKE